MPPKSNVQACAVSILETKEKTAIKCSVEYTMTCLLHSYLKIALFDWT